MKRNIIFKWFRIILLVLVFSACEKDEVPNDTVTDMDGNIYKTVQIGNQIWMAENLKTTKYNDGTNIPNIPDSSEWRNLTSPGYCWYNNDIANKTVYGALYNSYAVNTGKLAPKGWHVPNIFEWSQLSDYLGGDRVSGGKMKERSFSHWHKPNMGATNESGFTALPGGYRNDYGSFYYLDYYAYWWSSFWYGYYYPWTLSYSNSSFEPTYSYDQDGFSVRCVKD